MDDIRLVYLARQGVPQWEDWWVQRQGYTRSHVPSESELMGFANFDLRSLGLPELERTPDGAIGIRFAHGQSPEILNVLRRHGFEFKRVD
jgi:hypothetical protein